jgi:hypothetical protein
MGPRKWEADLFSDSTAAESMRADQIRLWFASTACLLLCALGRIGLAHTQLSHATYGPFGRSS